jgi:hypothetical protein
MPVPGGALVDLISLRRSVAQLDEQLVEKQRDSRIGLNCGGRRAAPCREGRLNPNVHGAAGVFLFRHYVELALKYVLFYTLWLENPTTNVTQVAELKNTHNLQGLWDRIKRAVPAKLGQDAWDGFDTAFIDKVVRDLHAADPRSETFRYMGETFGTEIGEELVVDFHALRAQMQHVFNVLHSMGVYLVETHGLSAEWAAEMNSW